MKPLEWLHQRGVMNRRVSVLSAHIAPLFPHGCRVLDVGCGDGALAAAIMRLRPDLAIEGIDVLARRQAQVPITLYDGHSLPFTDAAFDAVLLVDALHHAQQPGELLREARRVACRQLLIKDHCNDAILADATLSFMDWVGNSHQGVDIPCNYWPKEEWLAQIKTLDVNTRSWMPNLGLYPWPANLLFDRSLHFIADLQIADVF